jgi:hypothetical protein
MKWNAWSLYWLIWIAVGFMVPEMWALITRNPKNTLSYQVWHIEGTGATFARYFVFVFLLWLLIHMTFRAFT